MTGPAYTTTGFTMVEHKSCGDGLHLIETTQWHDDGTQAVELTIKCGGALLTVGSAMQDRLREIGFTDVRLWIEAVLVARLLWHSPMLSTNIDLVDSFLRDQVLKSTDRAQAVVAIATAVLTKLLLSPLDLRLQPELRLYADQAAAIVMSWYGEHCFQEKAHAG